MDTLLIVGVVLAVVAIALVVYAVTEVTSDPAQRHLTAIFGTGPVSNRCAKCGEPAACDSPHCAMPRQESQS